MAPRRRYVDRKLLKQLCMAQLTNEEIARMLRVSWDTLERRYAEPIKAWRKQGVASVRRELYSTALGDGRGKGAAMIFFLKNYGGMADVVREDALDRGDIPVPSEFKPKTNAVQ